ncbi:MAG: arsenate reductase ArsC [Ignavibacteria bacterium]|nr:arsenate reductase ArsC [Ignavibacteria bacterium]
MYKILILCTGNSCRSQMAEGFLKSLDSTLEVFSAGTSPASKVNPYAIKVMNEIGIDISNNRPKHLDEFLDNSFDYVITVCDNAKQTCVVPPKNADKILHIGFEDPADATGTEEEILRTFRKVRDEIREAFSDFYFRNLRKNRD